ncbi:MAG: hypothetical protein HC794_10680, partial [Nitrospiraceae bacterium]|nr:hypothetical protein [Nitrospiraceae bacterium]
RFPIPRAIGTEAAKRLGVSRATFYRRLVELDIPPR